MLVGMTGFAQASARFKDIQLNVEIRSLNHRYLECLVHAPDGFGIAEEMIKALVKSKFQRGRVTVALSVANLHPKVSVDYVLADSYARSLKHLNQKLKLDNHLSLSQIINLDGILKIEKVHLSAEFIQALKALINKALEKLVHIRQKEGRALARDILKRSSIIQKETDKIMRAVGILHKEKKGKLLEEEYNVFLRNTDIAEELTRIRYHLKNFLATFGKSASCGKELDFISQEIQREANTISAKAQSGEISQSVVKIKSAIDQIREQAQNVE
jgi:uncharacterized protein (TIGR00255 family)